MDSLTSVITARILEPLEKINTKFISVIAEKYGIDKDELNELYAIVCKEETKGMKRSRKSKKKGVKKTTGFLLFSKEERIKIKTEREKAKLPELSFGDTSKVVGTRWKSLSDEEKAEYILKAKEENERRKQMWEKEKKNEEKTKPKKKTKKVIDDEISVESDFSIEEEEKDTEDAYISESGDEEESTTPKTCIAILRSGKRKHEMCAKKVQDGAEYCKSHNK